MPSRKWFAATVTSLAGWLTAFFVAADMHWTDPIKVGLITLLAQAALSYITPNSTDDVARMNLTAKRPRRRRRDAR
jgi:hypothetical protein